MSDYIIETPEPGLQGLDSKALLDRVSRGDQPAFLELYRRCQSPIYNFIFRLVHDRAGAEDILQEVFLGVWKGARNFHGKSKVETWIYRIAYNRSVSWLREHRDDMLSDDVENLAAVEHDNQTDTLEMIRMHQALNYLSAKHRSVIELTYFHGMSYREIAGVLGIPVGTVKSRMNYALKAMEQALINLGVDRG